MDFFYEDILDALEEQNIALFLGPGILKESSGISLQERMLASLDIDNPDNPMIKAYYKKDGFFLFQAENQRKRVVRRIKGFYEGEFSGVDGLLDKIIKIPFPVIISMIPDTLITRAFTKAEIPFEHDFYYMGQPFKPFVRPTKEKPLVYSLLGSMEEPESMVMTHKDLFKYLESIFQGKSMSGDLRKLIQDTDGFVFLGLPFDKWYMQLLLRVLYHISSRLEKIEQYACVDADAITTDLYKDEFKIQFVEDDSDQFIGALFKKCDEKEMLRIAPDKSVQDGFAQNLDKARDYLAKNKIEKAFDLITEVLEAHLPKAQNFLNEIIKYQQSYSELHKKEVTEMATDSDKANLNQTIFNCIAIIPQISEELGL